LERDAQYVRARGLLETSRKNLEEAKKLFLESARGGGGRFHDGDQKARIIDGALRAIAAPAPVQEAVPAERNPVLAPPVRTSTIPSTPRP
jgi:hypothetical protein